MTVTKLEPQKRRKDRWSVYLDGEFAFGLGEVDLLYYKLREGAEISLERVEYIRDQIVLTEASQKALDYLSYRPRTVKEVEKKLTGDYAPDIITRVMDMLYSYKYIDDAAYAAEYVKERASAGYGPRKIEWELRERGVGRELIDAALEQVEGERVRIAAAALRARYRNKPVMDDKERSRAFGFLARRGFDAETADEALRLL
ncbi:MAG: RecX family transcriptional regulator [Clostridiales bacterium]|jgi:regulatory protein|nr:RecX family transcriptional regulator [Clostridiales bacterium]